MQAPLPLILALALPLPCALCGPSANAPAASSTASSAASSTASSTASPTASSMGTPASPWAGTSPGVPGDLRRAEEPQTAAELLALIRAEGDKTPSKAFVDLAKLGTREAFINLKVALDNLHRSTALNYACRAFRHFAGRGELEGDSISFLAQRAFRAGREEEQRAAALGLAQFKSALPELEDVLLRHRDQRVRTLVMRPLIPVLAERGGDSSLELILENAALDAYQRRLVVAALEGFAEPQHTDLMLARVKRAETSDAWSHLLLDALTPRPSGPRGDITYAFLDLAQGDNLPLALKALTLIGQRILPGGVDSSPETRRGLLKALTGFIKRDDAPALLAVVTPILARTYALAADRPPSSWRNTVKRLRLSREAHRRRAACSALAHSGRPEDVDSLLDFLHDSDWSVRAAAVQAIAGLRLRRTLPHIIDLLAEAQGRTRKDCVRALRVLTGLNHGTAAPRWQSWWQREGQAFTLPSLDAALAAEQARLARADSSTTKTSFYGLRIESRRVAFILDMSGSMNAKVEGSQETRRAVALSQVKQAVASLPEGAFFNIIFFATSIYPWMDSAVALKKDTRAAALSFIDRQTLSGATNIYDALLFALEDPALDTLFLMSDGAPSGGPVNDVATIRAQISALNAARGIVIHGIAVGQKSALLRGLSEDSGGSYREVL